MKLRIAAGTIGLAMMAFAVVGIVGDPDTHTFRQAYVLAELVILHDGIFLPLVLLAGVLLARFLPAAGRPVIQGALIASLAVTVVALPFVLGYGRQADNPSILPLAYGPGYLWVLAAIWIVALTVLGVRIWRTPRAGAARPAATTHPTGSPRPAPPGPAGRAAQ